MHILLTGASGLVGSSTLHYLLSQNHTVLATDITPLPSTTPHLSLPSTFQILDLTNHIALSTLFTTSPTQPLIEAVIHLGAIPHPLNRDPCEVYANNTVSNYNVLRVALEHGVRRLTQASSVNAPGLTFTKEERQRFDRMPLDEETVMRPVGWAGFGNLLGGS